MIDVDQLIDNSHGLVLKLKEEIKMMTTKYLLLAALFVVWALTACNEPRRTPDGHLMDRPKVSAYGPDDVTRHDTGASDADGKSVGDKK